MRNFMKLGFIAAAMLSMAACDKVGNIGNVGSTPTPTASSTGGVLSGTILDDRAMAGAEILYNVPANAYVAADKQKLISPTLKATLKPLMVSLYDRLGDVRAAYKLGDAPGFNAKLEALKDLSARVKLLIPIKVPGLISTEKAPPAISVVQ
jgi:hypothetical protein